MIITDKEEKFRPAKLLAVSVVITSLSSDKFSPIYKTVSPRPFWFSWETITSTVYFPPVKAKIFSL